MAEDLIKKIYNIANTLRKQNLRFLVNPSADCALEYLAKVAQHRRYLAGETRSDRDFPALKPVKPARKPKSIVPKAPPRPSVSIPVTSAQPAPTLAPAKPQEKKCKQSTETTDKPPKAKKYKYGFIGKKRTKFVAASVAEDAPATELQVAAEDVDLQKALEESMKSGKAKVTEEQVAHDLLSPQKPKKKSHADQYIFQRRTSTPTGSSGHDEQSFAELGQSECEESKKVMPWADEGGQGEGQAGLDPGQAGPDPGNAGDDVQSIPSLVVHAGSDREHMDLDVANISRNLPRSNWMKGLLQQPIRSDKPLNTDNDKANTETEVKSMVTVTIQQDMSSIPPMASPIIDLTSRPESPKNKGSEERLDSYGSRLYTLEQLDIPHQVSKAVSEVVIEAVDWAMQAPLRNRFRDLPEAKMKEILHQRMWKTESYKSHKDHMQLYEALKKLMNRDHSQELAQDLVEARKKNKKSRESPKTPPGSPPYQPPPSPPPAGPFRASGAPGASGSSQVLPPPPPPSSTN
nr:hypothetical protein [Tanacetum cinerariifolium]GEZ74049.1 hypothetical protein [Tanacetum cinerariifolium]